jgi:hypothetical protein
MDISKIISISGKSGLFRLISQTRNGIIVESLLDKSRMPVYSTQVVSSLEEISVFTTGEDLPLKKALQKIFSVLDGQKAIDPKSSNDELKAFLESMLPEYDKERVYASDIKKMISWYNILLAHGLIDLEADEKDDDTQTLEEKEETKE